MGALVLVVVAAMAIMAAAFFAGTETALLTASRLRIRHRARDGSARDAMLLRIVETPSLALASCVLGNCLAHTLAAACVTMAIVPLVPSAASLLSALALTPLVLILAEVVPKEACRRRGDDVLGLVLLPLRLWMILTAPLLAVGRKLFEGVWSVGPTEGDTVTRDDLRHLLYTGVASGVIHPRQQRMLSGALGLYRTTVREVMVPLTLVRAVREDDRVSTVLAICRATHFTRLPVYKERVDQVVGIVNVLDILYTDHDPQAPLAVYLRPCLFVPNTLAVDKILIRMQSRKESMAIVVDEFGGTDGILTIRDIVEEVVGELSARPPDTTFGYRRIGSGCVEVEGSRDIDRINEELALEIPKTGFETLAGFLMTALEKVPEVGDKLTLGGAIFEVLEVRGRMAHRVAITIHRDPAGSPSASRDFRSRAPEKK